MIADQTTNAIPVITLWGQLLASIQGDVTDDQAAQLFSDVLESIARNGPGGLILDVSGVGLLDSHLCATLARLAAAAKLMGTRTAISGLHPDVAMTLQSMGVSFGDLHTTRSLEEAFAWLGVRARRDKTEVERQVDAALGLAAEDEGLDVSSPLSAVALGLGSGRGHGDGGAL